MIRIERNISIERLLDEYPDAVSFLIKRNLPCLVCGEPTWGTLEELARDKRWSDSAIDTFVREMNTELSRKRTQ